MAELKRIEKERKKLVTELESMNAEIESIKDDENVVAEVIRVRQRRLRTDMDQVLGFDRNGAMYIWVDLGRQTGLTPNCHRDDSMEIDVMVDRDDINDLTDEEKCNGQRKRPRNDTVEIITKMKTTEGEGGHIGTESGDINAETGNENEVLEEKDGQTGDQDQDSVDIEIDGTGPLPVFGIIVQYNDEVARYPPFSHPSVNIPVDKPSTFRFVTSLASLKSLLRSLNSRGVRERDLFLTLSKRLQSYGVTVSHPHDKHAGDGLSFSYRTGRAALIDKSLAAFGKWVLHLGAAYSQRDTPPWESGLGFLEVEEISFSVADEKEKSDEYTDDIDDDDAVKDSEGDKYMMIMQAAVGDRLLDLTQLPERSGSPSAESKTKRAMEDIKTLPEAVKMAACLVSSRFGERSAKEIQRRLSGIMTWSSLSLFLADISRVGNNAKGIKDWLMEDEGGWVLEEEAAYEKKTRSIK